MSGSGSGRTALVAGATGLVGRHCLEMLLASERYRQGVALGRRAVGIAHPRLTDLVIDLGTLADRQDLPVADDVFCCLGTTMRRAGSKAAFRRVDFEYPLVLARTMLGRGATHFLVVSSVGANPRSLAFYLRVKGELERALLDLPWPQLTILRPSLLLGAREEVRVGERMAGVVLSALAPMLRGSLRRHRPIAARDVARAMVRAAERDTRGSQVLEAGQIAELGGA